MKSYLELELANKIEQFFLSVFRTLTDVVVSLYHRDYRKRRYDQTQFLLVLLPIFLNLGIELDIHYLTFYTKHRDNSLIRLKSFPRIKLSMARKKQTLLHILFEQKKHIAFLVLATIVLLLTVALSPEIQEHLSKEDGWIENMTISVLLGTTTIGVFSRSKKYLKRERLSLFHLLHF